MSQRTDILNHLKRQGGLTALDALDIFGCFRLSSRISELRSLGHHIETVDVRLPNGKIIASYYLKERHET